MKILYSFLRESKSLATWAVVAALVSGVSSTAVIWVIHRAMVADRSATGLLLQIFVGLCLLVIAAQTVAELVLLRLSEGTVFEMRLKMARRILRTPLIKLEELGAHRLLATIATDVRTVAQAVTLSPLFAMYAAILVAGSIYMLWLDWRIFLLLQVSSVLVLGPYLLATRRAEKLLAMAREDNDTLFKALRGLSEGTKELKINFHRRQAFLRELLEAPADSVRRRSISGHLSYRIAGICGRILFLVGLGTLLFVIPAFLEVTSEKIQGFVIVFLYMNMPLTGLLNMLATFGGARVAMRKIDQLGFSLASSSETEPEQAPALPAKQWNSVELVGVTHTYTREGEDGAFTLGPIDLTVKPGEILFLVGGNGSGKTTLAKLLVGLYAPESGEIRFDGDKVEAEDLETYRNHFSMVFTDFFLFEKILGLSGDGLDERAEVYVEKLLLSNKVKIRDSRLSTTDLSQGQRKRLALLSAYLEDRPIYVFDEWAADQDPTFKRVFYRQLLPELKERGKAVVVISHDDHYYEVADRLVKLDYGTIEAEYTPDQAPGIWLDRRPAIAEG